MTKDVYKKHVTEFGKRLPDQAQDQYYDTAATRLDTIIGGNTGHYKRLVRAKDEYDALAAAVPVGQGFLTFYDYVKEYYGIKLMFEGDEIQLGYAIIDEQKYTMFVLKFDA